MNWAKGERLVCEAVGALRVDIRGVKGLLPRCELTNRSVGQPRWAPIVSAAYAGGREEKVVRRATSVSQPPSRWCLMCDQRPGLSAMSDTQTRTRMTRVMRGPFVLESQARRLRDSYPGRE